MLVTCFAYSSTLELEQIYFSEYSVGFQRTTRRYIPRIGEARNQNAGSLFGLFFGLDDGGDMFLPKIG
jgi:hypothetical protein